MQLIDIDHALDMDLILKLREDTPFIKSSSDLDFRIPVMIHNSDGKLMMSAFFPKFRSGKKVNMNFSAFNPVEKEDFFVIDERINNIHGYEIIEKLLRAPSCVMSNIDIFRGDLNIYIRFHSSKIEDISELLSKYIIHGDHTRVEYLGPTRGIQEMFERLNNDYGLSVVSYALPLDDEEKEIVKELASTPFIGELKNDSVQKDHLETIIYLQKSRLNRHYSQILAPVSEDSGVFEAMIESRNVSEIRKISNDQHIPRFRYFFKLIKDMIEIDTFLPTSALYDYYTEIFRLIQRTNGSVYVKYISNYSQDVWKYI
ncbi:hypothetical protein [Thermoplasma sp.]|uniref:hypothetical protein n=1 Tax=Thermoplasma sp. TaxID=1973142 RepID=UPI0012873531|nr:hypothetical protein [Thermoplasma sp.]KAA8922206.1 MAG: hypothetical protein F6Q11_05615 [Thermoplasma sp.]